MICRLAGVFPWILLELRAATLAAEVVRLPLVLDVDCGRRGVDCHAANGIEFGRSRCMHVVGHLQVFAGS